ncbi:MAG: hypothetical protein RBR81_10005 [Bacteroidales bacterium]|nr:hypothetical protein [Bacteroidales bacterium]
MKLKKSYKLALFFMMILKIVVFSVLVLGSCNRYVHSANSNKIVYKHK